MTIQVKYAHSNTEPTSATLKQAFSSITVGSTAAHAAMLYIKHGMSPVPVPHGQKAPALKGWTTFKCPEEEILAHFGGHKNISVITGVASGGLVDIDLDSASAIALAPKFLPPTDCVFGRASKPASHYLYRANASTKKTPYHIAADGVSPMLLEIGSDKSLTVFPPSVHSGENIRFESGKSGLPTEVDYEELRRAATLLACAALIREIWPAASGCRQELALALAGGLLKTLAKGDVEKVLASASKAAGDEEYQKRKDAVSDTESKKTAGEKITGWPKAAELIDKNGTAVVGALRKWLCPWIPRRLDEGATSPNL